MVAREVKKRDREIVRSPIMANGASGRRARDPARLSDIGTLIPILAIKLPTA